MVSSFLLKFLNPFPFCNENFFFYFFSVDIFVCSVCNAKFYDCFIHKCLLDIEHGVFFVVKQNSWEPPTYFLWCHSCKSLNKFLHFTKDDRCFIKV